jgi:hypothetical protein
MRPADRSLLLTAGLGLLAGACLVVGGLPAPLSAAAGALLALGLPGYALLRALFAGHHLDGWECVVLVLGLDLAIGILTGLALHVLPSGLSAASWGAVLGSLTVAGCAIAWLRERSLEAVSRPTRAAIPASQLTMLAAAGVVSLLALVVARAGVVAQPQPGYTALSIHPDDSGTLVRVGVADSEGHPQGYRLVVTLDGVVIAEQADLPVSNGATTFTEVQLPPAGAVLREVTAQLWRSEDGSDAAPYRWVRASVRGHAGVVAPAFTPVATVPDPP